MSHKIIFCENDEDFAANMSRTLAPYMDDAPLFVSNKGDFLKYYEPHFSVVVLDMGTLEKDGFQVLENIMIKNPLAVVVVTTANSSESLAIECLRRRVYEYVKKPVKMEDFLKILESACAEAEKREPLMALYAFQNENQQHKKDTTTPSKEFNVRHNERCLIEKVLGQTQHNITEAAKLMGIGRSTFYRKLKKYEIQMEDASRLNGNVKIA